MTLKWSQGTKTIGSRAFLKEVGHWRLHSLFSLCFLVVKAVLPASFPFLPVGLTSIDRKNLLKLWTRISFPIFKLCHIRYFVTSTSKVANTSKEVERPRMKLLSKTGTHSHQYFPWLQTLISWKILSIWLLDEPHPLKILIRQLLSGNKVTFNVIMVGLQRTLINDWVVAQQWADLHLAHSAKFNDVYFF